MSSLSFRFVAALVTLAVLAGCSSNSHPNRIKLITLSPASASITVGQTEQFTGTATTNSGQTITGSNMAATWASSNTAVATVDANGMATGVAAGSTTITATVQTGGGPVTGSASLTVTPPSLVSILVSPSDPSIATGQTQQFTAMGTYSDNSQNTLTSATWSSSDTTVATIDNSGLATAATTGSTLVTASSAGVSGNTTLSVTAAGQTTNSYVGTQSPGELWLLSVNDTAKTFSATNQSASLSYAGTFSALPNGFYKTTLTSSTDAALPVGTNGYAVEVPGVALVISLGGGAGKPIAGIVPGQCPTISGALTADLINLGKPTYDSTSSESYASVSATQSGSSYSFNLQSYLLDGTLRTSQSGPLPTTGTCSNGVITVPNVPTGDGGISTVTAIAASNGLYVLDLGHDSVSGDGRGGAVGTTTEIGPTQISAALGLNYLGFVYKRNSTPMTTFVGFGPGSGSSTTGGPFTNQDTDPFGAHGTGITISLPSANSNGFLQGTVTDANGTHTPFVAVITSSGGKYFLFGITTDTSNTTPYAILLEQQ